MKHPKKSKIYEIHGNFSYLRCENDCRRFVIKDEEIPKDLNNFEIKKCDLCKGKSYYRPHILLFDEYYNEHHYFIESVTNFT